MSFFPQPEMPDVSGCLLEKYLQRAEAAFRGVSFRQELRGAQVVKEYSDILQSDMEWVTAHGGDAEQYRQKFEALFSAWIAAKSQCISTMITGGSNFPVRRAEKANDSERKRADELEAYRMRVKAALLKAERREAAANSDPLEEAKADAQKERAQLELMKAANAVIRNKKLDEAGNVAGLKALGIPEGAAKKLLLPDFAGRIGFADYQLTNCRARLKQREARVAELERRATTEAKEQERPDGIKIVENAAENRLQVFFPGKPADDVRSKLKSAGFRWTPSQGCWQAYLNANSKYKIGQILPS